MTSKCLREIWKKGKGLNSGPNYRQRPSFAQNPHLSKHFSKSHRTRLSVVVISRIHAHLIENSPAHFNIIQKTVESCKRRILQSVPTVNGNKFRQIVLQKLGQSLRPHFQHQLPELLRIQTGVVFRLRIEPLFRMFVVYSVQKQTELHETQSVRFVFAKSVVDELTVPVKFSFLVFDS